MNIIWAFWRWAFTATERKGKMKVLLINGSMHKNGCTYTALSVLADELRQRSVETEIAWIGNRPIQGCIGCWKCKKQERCVFENDIVNSLLEKIKEADGYIFGSPVYFASANGAMVTAMDRIFTAGAGYFLTNQERLSVQPGGLELRQLLTK